MSLEQTVIAICFGLFIIVGGSIAYNLSVSYQERKKREKRRGRK